LAGRSTFISVYCGARLQHEFDGARARRLITIGGSQFEGIASCGRCSCFGPGGRRDEITGGATGLRSRCRCCIGRRNALLRWPAEKRIHRIDGFECCSRAFVSMRDTGVIDFQNERECVSPGPVILNTSATYTFSSSSSTNSNK